MNPVKFDEANKIYTAPKSMPDCKDLHTFADGEKIISCWELSPEEKVMAVFFGKVWLCIYGQGHPVVSLFTGNSVFPAENESDDDFWKRQSVELGAFADRKAAQYIARYGGSDNTLDAHLQQFLLFALGIGLEEETEKV